MTSLVNDIRGTFVPAPGGRHGPLPPLLIGLTLVTGLVDAFSYLLLGHVFVANMTGNVVFLGFALAGAPGFSITASLVALVAFAAGALLGGLLATRHGAHPARLFSVATSVQALFLTAAAVLAGLSGNPLGGGLRHAQIWLPLVIALAVAVAGAGAGAVAAYVTGKSDPPWVRAQA